MSTLTQIKPRPVFCIVEHAYQDLKVAEAVSAGRFTHAGITLDLGLEPDWLQSDFPADAEWRIEWSKFYYGLDMAFAYRETGDEKYLRAWEGLVASWIEQMPVDFDPSDVTGRRIQNWIYAWEGFASSPGCAGFTDGFEERILASLSEQVAYLRSHLTRERNHRTLELYALFIAGVALPELDCDGSLLDFALMELQSNLLADVRPDGVHRESSTHYHMVTLRSYLGVCVNTQLFDMSLPEQFAERLERACEFAMHCHRPDGLIPALSDSDTGSYQDLLQLATELFERPDFLYVATGGAHGRRPHACNVSFPDGGYYIQRSDWGRDASPFREARFLIFDCGPLGDGGHGHYDLLNIEIAAHGRPLVIDPGRYTYSEQGEVNWRRWFKGTAAHNTVSVDGLDQTPYRCGKPRGETALGRLLGRWGAPGLEVLEGQAQSPAYEVRHTRRIFFINGEYWLICDELRGSRPHHFDLRFHLSPEAWNQTLIEQGQVNQVVRAPHLALVFEAARVPRLEEGWFAPKYGVKFPAPVASVVAEGVAEARFLTVIAPLDESAPAPTFLAQAEQTGAGEIISVEINGTGQDGASRDRLTWSTSPQPFKFESFQGRASAAWARTSPAGESMVFAACDLLELEQATPEGVNSLRAARPLAWVAWDERRGLSLANGGAR